MLMVEALKGSVEIEDLGISLSAGIPVAITEPQRKISSCIKHLERLGKIRVYSSNLSERAPPRARNFKTVKSKPPPLVALMGENPIPQTSTEEMIDRAVQKAIQAVSVQKPPPVQVEPQELLEDRVERAVLRALSRVPSVGFHPAPNQKISDSEPLFIPTGIVSKESQDIKVTTVSSDNEIGGAAAALKAARRKK